MLPEDIIARTRRDFPAYAREGLEALPLEKGGSGRKFYRLRPKSEEVSLIVVRYTEERQENSRYVDIARFLHEAGVRVPAIYRHEPAEGLIWMQDLGETDLWAFRHESWEVRRPLYENTLREAMHLHVQGTARLESSGIALEKEFNEDLYHWEQNYFLQNCLGAIFGIDEETVNKQTERAEFSKIARRLAAEPRVLVHRDFQSQNILIQEGSAWLIDFQGMRPGLAQYDLASLLYDPYVTLTLQERADLLAYYKSLRSIQDDSFDEIFYLCALQRLMQALGAYGFLGLQKGKREFLRHVAPAYENLKSVAGEIESLRSFRGFLDTLTPPSQA